MRSRLPSNQELSVEMIKFLEDLDKRVSAQTDLSSSPTNEEIATALNGLFEAMRSAGKMEAN